MAEKQSKRQDVGGIWQVPQDTRAALWMSQDAGAVALRLRGHKGQTIAQLWQYLGRRGRLIWEGRNRKAEPSLHRLPSGEVLCLLPEDRVVKVSRDLACSELSGIKVPVRIGIAPEGGTDPLPVLIRKGRKVQVARLQLDGDHAHLEAAVDLPTQDPDDQIAQLCVTSMGGLALLSSNARTGFQAWYKPALFDWRLVTHDGAWRNAFNADISGCLVLEDDVLIAAGLGPQTLKPLMGVTAVPDLLRLRAGQEIALLCGEPRPSPMGLLLPLPGLHPAIGRETGLIRALRTHGEGVDMVLQVSQKRALVLHLDGHNRIALTAEISGYIFDLAPHGDRDMPAIVFRQ